MAATARQTKLLHWARNLLRLSPEDYEARLSAVAPGKTSSKQLHPTQAAQVLAGLEAHMRAVGVTPPWLEEYPAELAGLGERRGMASQKQLRLAWRLWRRWRSSPGRRAQEPSDLRALTGFLQARAGLSDARFLTRVRAINLIDTLKEMVGRS